MSKKNDFIMHVIPLLEEQLALVVDELYQDQVKDLGQIEVLPTTDTVWGDYYSSVALKLGSELKQSPEVIAKNIVSRLHDEMENENLQAMVAEIYPSKTGFINFKMSVLWLNNLLNYFVSEDISYGIREIRDLQTTFNDKKIIVEYTDPNPFKVFHIGHLVPNSVGESLSRIFEYCGAEVLRANYQGDTGMHVAKSIWGMLKNPPPEENLSPKEYVSYLGRCYAAGAKAYDDDRKAQEEIQDLNLIVYAAAQDHIREVYGREPQVDYKKHLSESDMDFEKIKGYYRIGRTRSLEYFEEIYSVLGTRFDKYYFESSAGEFGYRLVKDFLEKGVFEVDNDAVIFRGEDYGLHNRVFINSMDLPTYEAKDLGLAFMKKEDFDYDLSYIITAVEQAAYFQVVLKALEQIETDLARSTRHISNGLLSLANGKMSSRTGEVLAADELISEIRSVVQEKISSAQKATDLAEDEKDSAEKIAVAAFKYSILKQQVGKDIIFDRELSLRLTGDTGPYLQYTFVRILSLLEKGDFVKVKKNTDGSYDKTDLSANGLGKLPELCEEEELLLRYLAHFDEEILRAARELSPSFICTYLHGLAAKFNVFYASVPVLNEEEAVLRDFRVRLSYAVGVALKTGLNLLGIETVSKM